MSKKREEMRGFDFCSWLFRGTARGGGVGGFVGRGGVGRGRGLPPPPPLPQRAILPLMARIVSPVTPCYAILSYVFSPEFDADGAHGLVLTLSCLIA